MYTSPKSKHKVTISQKTNPTLKGFLPSEISLNNSLGVNLEVNKVDYSNLNQNRTGISFYPGYNQIKASTIMDSASKQDIDSTTAINSASMNMSKVKNPHKKYNFHLYPK